ncbi:MAG: efflux RND transporter periplasmic adaptor subunit [Gemmatimonadetes bacterium]|nr:efflux RND transporter periplasmic adaptor subunit [Gemmatimonadota bacterium]
MPTLTKTTTYSMLALLTLAGAGACAVSEAREVDAPATTAAYVPTTEAVLATAVDTLLPTVLPADGVAAPMREAMLSTKLMATVTEVLVHEGDQVRAGQLLARLDARDVTAKAEQVAASVAAAEAGQAQAAANVARMRALFADDAAPKATLEQAEAQFAQADAGLRAARAAGAEVSAIGSYSEIRAPFAGRVTHRFVDPGAFAAPGAPIVTVQDDARLRLTVHITPEAARALRAGQRVEAMIEGQPAMARIEGLVPSMGNLYAVNAIVENAAGEFLAGSAAALQLSGGTHRAIAIPADAVTYTGDLTGVTVRTGTGDVRRWVRLGARSGDLVEVTSGLRAGEQVLRRGTDGSN